MMIYGSLADCLHQTLALYRIGVLTFLADTKKGKAVLQDKGRHFSSRYLHFSFETFLNEKC
jgi:hypothetical protein